MREVKERDVLFEIIEALDDLDFEKITNLVRDDVEMSPKVRAMLADVLLGLIRGELPRRPPHRPKSQAAEERRAMMVNRVIALEREGWPREAAIAKTAEEFKCSTRWVSRVLSENKELDRIDKVLTSLMREAMRRDPELAQGILDKMVYMLIWDRHPDEVK